MGEAIGYWNKTWDAGGAPQGATLGIAFSGWAAPKDALPPANAIKSRLVGAHYVGLGGGNRNGGFDAAIVASVVAAIEAGEFAAWDGIAFDVEVCLASGLGADFARAFVACKAKGLGVLVTVSHSAPFGCADRAALMQGSFADANIDYLSPQLYTSGEEHSNDYAEDPGVTWADYAAARAAVVPSLVEASMYADARAHFAARGVTLGGFVQWARIA